MYQEENNSTAQHNGKIYRLNTLFKLTANRKISLIKTQRLSWVLEHCTLDEERVA